MGFDALYSGMSMADITTPVLPVSTKGMYFLEEMLGENQ